MSAKILARLRFHRLDSHVSGQEERGEAILYADRTVRLKLGRGLEKRLSRTATRLDHGSLVYGATAFMALVATGSALVVKRKTVAGFATLAAAGLTALGASYLRGVAKQMGRPFDFPIAASHFDAALDDEHVTLSIPEMPWLGATLRFGAGEYDRKEAEFFASELNRLARD